MMTGFSKANNGVRHTVVVAVDNSEKTAKVINYKGKKISLDLVTGWWVSIVITDLRQTS